MRRSYPSDGVNEMVTKEMICAAHDICLKKGDFVLSASLLERIYLAMRDKADGRDSAGWDAYEDLRKASDEMVLNLRQRIAELEKFIPELQRDSARYNWLISQEAWEPPREALPKWYGGKIKWLGGDYSIDETNEIIDKARGES